MPVSVASGECLHRHRLDSADDECSRESEEVAFYDGGALKRALFINLVAYNGAGAARPAVHVALGGSGNVTVKRLSIPCVRFSLCCLGWD